MKRKLFAGTAVRDLREKRGLTQFDLAQRIGVSPSYLSQIESNQRPLSASIVVELARVLRVDVAQFSDADSDRLASALREVLSVSLLGGSEISLREIKDAALNAPRLAHALVDLYGSYRRLDEKYRSLDEALQANEGRAGQLTPLLPFDEVRDFFHFIGNYVDSLDRAAEDLAAKLAGQPGSMIDRLAEFLQKQHGCQICKQRPLDGSQFVSAYDPLHNQISLNETLPGPTQLFALARHIAYLSFKPLITTAVTEARLMSTDAKAICFAALANYFAGALLMPYARLQKEARRSRHDVEGLAGHFGVSMEQVCHRLSTLQRPGSEGIPFYFLRVDRAGNITKRHSATRFQFARYGGACPLWNIHEAFETPNRFLIQVAEMPDGIRYLSLAHAVMKSAGRFDPRHRHYALGFGCELTYANELIYSQAIDIKNPSQLVKIGVSCRLCERTDCQQRAVPPIDLPINIDLNQRDIVPYRIGSRTGLKT